MIGGQSEVLHGNQQRGVTSDLYWLIDPLCSPLDSIDVVMSYVSTSFFCYKCKII
ncbi:MULTISPECIES: hypothetical protein [Priestia]|uniref:hypothetical protein n=1 Tax=Priestia TaxID=2800373 RepID=UPI0018A2F113|nr:MULTISPECIES: hypothetical protein [Priestia]QTL47281.1 hypothetical protein J5Z55_14360 [Priestia aryabhattai]